MPSENNAVTEHKPIKITHWVFLVLFFSLAVFLVGKNATDFQASVIPSKQAAPFDGTTLPVLKVPKWTALKGTEGKLPYDQFSADKLIPLMTYDPSVLKTPVEQLGWKTDSDLAIRNAKITFTTPYMGDYKLDGLEYAGSHLAVDIKIPVGTPIYAIGNGIVQKVADQESGF
jgi:murein DD-endopeptidase MepM/ murein hydrolase activator NlpD